MSITASEMTPADIAAVTGNGGGYNGGMGWGGEWSMWIIIFLIFGFFGWGGGGFGGFGGGGNGAASGYVLTTDVANLERKLDGVNNGLCDGFYQQAQLVNGVTQNMNNGFMTAELSRANQQAALMQQLNAMQMQTANCCCETREAIQGVNYNLATQGCDTRNTIQNTTRDIIDAMNNGFRGIDQRLTAQELAAKDAQIAQQNQRLFMAELRASQEAQNGYLVSMLRTPTPIPAYSVPNPNCCYQQCG